MQITLTGTDGRPHARLTGPAARSTTEQAQRVAMALLVLLALYLVSAPSVDSQTAPREITVGPGEQVTRISAALAQARDGDRIRILPGTYREGTIEVNRSVALLGEGWPVLDGEGEHAVLRVTADNVEIRGLVIRGAGVSMRSDNAAVRFEETRGCTVEGNRLEDNFFGIYLAKTSDCRIADNQIRASGTRETTSGNGLHLWNASDVVAERNVITGHRDGFYLEFANNVALRDNRSEGNLRYGLHFMFSNRTAYTGNTFRNNGAGVAVMYSKEVEVSGNEFADNWGATAYGLLIKDITDSAITGNTFRGNTAGIYSEGSTRVEVRGNHFLRNGWAVRIMSNSRENRFTDNNFIGNAFDVTTNSRQNFNTFAGNYWSGYSGYDLTGDGFGDVPHRPVRLFSLIVERTPAAMVLLRSIFVDLLDMAERVIPALTPATLVDEQPRIREVRL